MQRREFIRNALLMAAGGAIGCGRQNSIDKITEQMLSEPIKAPIVRQFSQFANFIPSAETIQKANPHFLIWINLPEFTLRLYENGKQIDETLISAGRRNSPQVEAWRSLIEIRPSFTPTPNEIKKGYKPCPPDRTNPPDTPRNPLGRRRILIASPKFKLHGTAVPSSIGDARSNGCTRVDNEGIERITDYIISKLPIKSHRGKAGGYESYEFSVPFQVIQCYRLWDKLYIEGNKLHLTAYPDIHKHLLGKRDYGDFPLNQSTTGNAYSYSHLLSDFEKMGIKPKEGISGNSPFFKKFFGGLKELLIGADEPMRLEVLIPKGVFSA